MKELADLVHISPMAINYYEKEERKPDMNMIKALAKALNVRVTDFLACRDAELVFCHGEFKKNNPMLAKQQKFVREEVEEYFGRFFRWWLFLVEKCFQGILSCILWSCLNRRKTVP